MMNHDRRILVAVLLCGFGVAGTVNAEDWPMWRRSSARSAVTTEALPKDLHLRWIRQFPKLKPAYREKRLQFDAGYEPIVKGKTLFVASSRSDRVVALDVETGGERWAYYAEGPVRFAPVAWRDRVIFGSDDGYLYCLSADSGKLHWKFRAVPSTRKVLGNGRMISLWPVRGGPVVDDNKVYFAAGVWSFEGVFVYCLDASTGNVVWRNDEASFVYGTHPHAAEALGGVTPQGYLVVARGESGPAELIVPCGQAMPARFDLKTGKLKEFELPKPGRRPGGWFASAAVRRGEVILDAEVNRDLHEDKVYQGPGSRGVRSTITVADQKLRFSDKRPDVTGETHTMLAADGKLFVVDLEGRLYCFGDKPRRVSRYADPTSPSADSRPSNEETPAVRRILRGIAARRGYALIRNSNVHSPAGRQLSKERLAATIDALLNETEFHVVVTDSSEGRLKELRQLFRHRRDRLCLLYEAGSALALPRYFASLLISNSRQLDRQKLGLLRPYGGTACYSSALPEDERRLPISSSDKNDFSVRSSGDLTFVRRGGLTGAANYTGGWSSPDERVRAPLGVLWFDDALGHFKRSPQPWFVDGVMVSYPKDWMQRHQANRKPPYKLMPPVLSDVYTGRVIAGSESIAVNLKYPQRDLTEAQPNQYRPPTQRDAWKPKQPIIGERLNPLTGQSEPRAIPKSYGCDGGVDYGLFFTMRSGTPAFYDKRLESGVCNISGPRSGCTNSLIPACGVLNVPYFYEGCTCSYPMPVGLALVSMPAEFEQWSSWGPGKADAIQRVGVNLGAPGDRMTEAGTLWLDYPSRGGPSPQLNVTVEPASAEYYYRHSLFAQGGQGWPWVAGSGVQGARTVKIAGFRSGKYTVRLYFSRPDHVSSKGSDSIAFAVAVKGKQPAKSFDVELASADRMKSMVRELTDIEIESELRIDMQSRRGRSILCGVEVIRSGLKLDGISAR